MRIEFRRRSVLVRGLRDGLLVALLALTTATAFSPADTMPNSQRAKVLMSTQGLISLITLGLIISRAVGILQ